MHLSSDRVSRAFLVASELHTELTIGKPGVDEYVISIEQLEQVVSAKTGVTIEKQQVAFEGSIIRGKIERWNKGKNAKIYIRHDQTDEWKRFVTTKELLHIVVDQQVDFSPYGDQTLDELVLAGHFGWLNTGDVTAGYVQSEIVAEIAALETLYPLNLRREDVPLMGPGGLNNLTLAARYKIPVNYVSTALNLKYLNLLSEAFAEQTSAKNGLAHASEKQTQA